jgi:hypothetical protein
MEVLQRVLDFLDTPEGMFGFALVCLAFACFLAGLRK